MRQLQLKRFDIIFKNRETALANLQKYENSYADGEIMAAAFYNSDNQTADNIAYIVGIYAKKGDKNKLFTIDVKNLEKQIENVENTLSNINGGSIQLSNTYNGEANAESPAKGDTIDSAIKKIVDIIIKNEKVVAASANDLNDKIGNLSGDAITNVSLDASKTKLVITKDGNNIEIPLTDLAKIYTFDTTGDPDHNIIFSTTTGSDGKVTIKGNIESFDCGEYEGQN